MSPTISNIDTALRRRRRLVRSERKEPRSAAYARPDTLRIASRHAKRHAATYGLIAMWVFATIGNNDSLLNDAHLVAELAQAYQNESSGYWVSM